MGDVPAVDSPQGRDSMSAGVKITFRTRIEDKPQFLLASTQNMQSMFTLQHLFCHIRMVMQSLTCPDTSILTNGQVA